MLEGRYDGTDLESWDYIAKRASAIRSKCVQGFNGGGWTKAGLVSQSIGVFVYGPNSKFEDFVLENFVCLTDSEGNAECDMDDVEDSNAPPSNKRPASGAVDGEPPAKVCADTCGASKSSSVYLIRGATCYGLIAWLPSRSEEDHANYPTSNSQRLFF